MSGAAPRLRKDYVITNLVAQPRACVPLVGTPAVDLSPHGSDDLLQRRMARTLPAPHNGGELAVCVRVCDCVAAVGAKWRGSFARPSAQLDTLRLTTRWRCDLATVLSHGGQT
jgi:hypothetical protein